MASLTTSGVYKPSAGTYLYGYGTYSVSETATAVTITLSGYAYSDASVQNGVGCRGWISGSYSSTGTGITNGSSHIAAWSTSKTIQKTAAIQSVQVGVAVWGQTVSGYGGYTNGSTTGSASSPLASKTATVTVAALSGSTVALSAASLDAGATITAAITRQSSAYTHRVTWSFGTQSTVHEDITTSDSLEIPLAWLAEIPSAANGTATCTVETLNGTTKIATTQASFLVTVPTDAAPLPGSLAVTQVYNLLSPVVPSDWGIYVQGRSGAKAQLSGYSARYGAGISSIAITGNGKSSATTSLSTGVLNSAGTNTITATVTDTRGKSSQCTAQIAVVAYDKPHIDSVLTQRANDSAQPVSDGPYALATCAYGISDLGGKNAAVRQLKFRESGTQNFTTVANGFNAGTPKLFGGSFDLAKSYDVVYGVQDQFYTIEVADIVSRFTPIMEIAQGGSGIAFFKEPDRAGFDVAGDAYFEDITATSIATDTPLPVTSGGTGAKTAAAARTNLGIAAPPSPSSSTPTPVAATGAAGTSALYARGDHAHAGDYETYSATVSGVTFTCRRYGKVVGIHIRGAWSAAVSNGTAVITLPTSFQPTDVFDGMYFAGPNYTATMGWKFNSSKQLCVASARSSGFAEYSYITYVI